MRRRDSVSEGRLPFEGVEDDAFQQVAQGEVVELGQGLQHLEQALLQAHAGLDALDDPAVRHLVPWYIYTKWVGSEATDGTEGGG